MAYDPSAITPLTGSKVNRIDQSTINAVMEALIAIKGGNPSQPPSALANLETLAALISGLSSPTCTTLSGSGTVNIDLDLPAFITTLSGNLTCNFTNMPSTAGKIKLITFIVVHHSSTTYTITFNAPANCYVHGINVNASDTNIWFQHPAGTNKVTVFQILSLYGTPTSRIFIADSPFYQVI